MEATFNKYYAYRRRNGYIDLLKSDDGNPIVRGSMDEMMGYLKKHNLYERGYSSASAYYLTVLLPMVDSGRFVMFNENFQRS